MKNSGRYVAIPTAEYPPDKTSRNYRFLFEEQSDGAALPQLPEKTRDRQSDGELWLRDAQG